MSVSMPVNMAQTLTVDAGVYARDMHADSMQANSLSVDGGTDVGPPVVLRGPVSISGPTQTTGAWNFKTAPSGLSTQLTLTRGTGLVLTTLMGWVSAGTVASAAVQPGDFCVLTSVPVGLNLLNLDYRCVAGAAQVDVQFKVLLGLTLPAGDYTVRAYR